MPQFRYRAVNAAGEIVEGKILAPDRLTVIERLHSDGNTPIRTDEVGGASRWELRLRKPFGGRKLDVADIALMSQEMTTLLRAGMSVERALTMLSSMADKPAKRAFSGQLLEKVRSGATLADALDNWKDVLPRCYAGMVRAGEASNSLPTIFARLAELLARSRAVRENIKSALYYPAIVLVVAGFTIAVLLTVVVPEFRPLFESAGAKLPWATRFVIGAGDIVTEFWWALLLAPVMATAAARWHYARAGGRLFWDTGILRLPLIGGLVLKLEVARFSRTLGTLLGSGVAELNALSIAASTVVNQAVAGAIVNVAAQLKRGDGWSSPLRDTNVFPEIALQMIQVGEESGQLHAMLIQLADIFDEDVQRALQRLLSLLVPVVTILLGLVVALIIGAMLTAILSTYSLTF